MKIPDIEQLINERPFELLTPAEREAVLAQMPEWEYQRLHQLVLRSKAAMRQTPAPDPAIRERLVAALRQQQKPLAQTAPRQGLLVRMAQYRLPAWQVAAGLALLLVAHFAQQETPAEAVRTETVYVNTTDTIYKEVAMPVVEAPTQPQVRRVNVKPRLASRPLPPAVETLANSAGRQQGMAGALPDTLPGFQFTVQQPNGRSANEMKELWQFLGEVY